MSEAIGSGLRESAAPVRTRDGGVEQRGDRRGGAIGVELVAGRELRAIKCDAPSLPSEIVGEMDGKRWLKRKLVEEQLHSMEAGGLPTY